jgi:hypothetical protein
MDLAKCGAAAFVTGCLGFQLYAIIPPTRFTHFWPFIDYPMYAGAYQRGASFSEADFRVLPCGSKAARPASAEELGIQWYNMIRLEDAVIGKPTYGSVVQATPDSAARLYATVIRRRIQEPICEAQIWGRTFVIEAHGLETADLPWQMLRRWSTLPGATGEMLPNGGPQP